MFIRARARARTRPHTYIFRCCAGAQVHRSDARALAEDARGELEAILGRVGKERDRASR